MRSFTRVKLFAAVLSRVSAAPVFTVTPATPAVVVVGLTVGVAPVRELTAVIVGIGVPARR